MNGRLCICGSKAVRRGMCWKHYRKRLRRDKLEKTLSNLPNGDMILSIVDKVEKLPWIGITQKTPKQAGFFRGIEEQVTTGDNR